MNRPNLYFKTTKIILDAYKDEKLFQCRWQHCFCAHLIASNMGYRVRIIFYEKGKVWADWVKNDKPIDAVSWGQVVQSSNVFYQLYIRLKLGKEIYALQKVHLASTGYTYKELIQLAEAFHACRDEDDQTRNILPGVVSALDVLKKIHSVDFWDVQGLYRSRFVAEERLIKSLPGRYPSVLRIEALMDNQDKQPQTKSVNRLDRCSWQI